jgi:hypothetical protein
MPDGTRVGSGEWRTSGGARLGDSCRGRGDCRNLRIGMDDGRRGSDGHLTFGESRAVEHRARAGVRRVRLAVDARGIEQVMREVPGRAEEKQREGEKGLRLESRARSRCGDRGVSAQVHEHGRSLAQNDDDGQWSPPGTPER